MMWKLIILLLFLGVMSQPPPPVPEPDPLNLGEKVPPPAGNNAAVQALIDEILSDEKPKMNKISEKINLNGPLRLLNTSQYWFLDNLAPEGSISDEKEAQEWLEGYLIEAEKILKMATEAGWNYFTNITDFNRKTLVESEEVLGMFLKSTAIQAKQYQMSSFTQNRTLQRLMHMLSIEGMSALSVDDFAQLARIKSQLAQILTNGAVCREGRPPPCTLRYSELQPLMATSRHPGQLLYFWLAWRNSVGPYMKLPYQEMVELSNLGANLNGFENAGALWRSPYEMTKPTLAQGPEFDLKNELERLFMQIKPLYVQLHAYVRRKLARTFNPTQDTQLTKDGPIPAHLLGSMNGDNWGSLYLETQPYPGDNLDFSADPWGAADPIGIELQRKNYTVNKMFKQAEEFFSSMGFPMLPESFWNHSIFERPWDRDLLCHPSTAFDFRDGEEYRVKSCAQVSQPDFTETHRLLAQSYYQYSYRDLPLPFREAANPSFAAAIGDAIGTASENPDYLKSLGISSHSLEMEQMKLINRLYQEAMEQVAAIPFLLVVDFWRWEVFDGSLTNETWNDGWWSLRKKYQGIKPPVKRYAHEFDPGSSPLISQEHFPAVRKFISYVMKYQILKGLCSSAGQTGTLEVSKCNLYGSKMAGEKLKTLMSLGSSLPWPQVLSKITGEQKLDATPIMEYYKPLMDWLEKENEKTQSHIGWDGPGTPFDSLDLSAEPEVDQNSVAVGNNKFAYAGEPCYEGQICVQESICNGTVCQCPDGTVQFEHHCLPSDPSLQGFGEGNGGFQINIVENEPEPQAEGGAAEPEPKSASMARISILITLICTSLLLCT